MKKCNNCPQPKLCEILGIHIIGRLAEIWSGKCNLTTEQCNLYRNTWLVNADKTWKDIPDDLRPANITHEQPKTVRLVWNFAKAVTKHVKSGAKQVTPEVYKARLKVCDTCIFRQNMKCLHKKCGCSLQKKAQWKSEECPDGKWPE